MLVLLQKLDVIDNGQGVGPDSDSAVVDLSGRGDASTVQTHERDQVLL